MKSARKSSVLRAAAKVVLLWLLAAFIVACWLLAASHFDQQRARVEAEDAIQTQAARDYAARIACGQNAVAVWLDDKTIECRTKHNRKTGKQVML